MNSNHRVPVVKDFWYKTEEEPDTTLYQDQLGWTIPLQVESGGYTDTHDVWKNLMERTSPDIVGWDLCFYYQPTGSFYYIDQMAKVLYKLPFNDNWDGKYIFEGIDVKPQLVPEEDELLLGMRAARPHNAMFGDWISDVRASRPNSQWIAV